MLHHIHPHPGLGARSWTTRDIAQSAVEPREPAWRSASAEPKGCGWKMVQVSVSLDRLMTHWRLRTEYSGRGKWPMPTMRQPQHLLRWSYGALCCRFFTSELDGQLWIGDWWHVTAETQAVHRAEQAYGEVRREIERRHTMSELSRQLGCITHSISLTMAQAFQEVTSPKGHKAWHGRWWLYGWVLLALSASKNESDTMSVDIHSNT